MNSPLAREDTEKHAGTRSCSYCNKVFTNYRALGGHLRIHQEGKPSGTLNYLGSSSNSIDTTRNPPASLPNSQRNSLPGVNNLTPFASAPPPFDPSWGICSNETNHASMTGFTDGNPGVAQTQIVMFQGDLACACACHHGSLASGRFVPTGPHPALSSAAFTPSSIVITPGFDIDTSLHLGPNGVCQFNTDEFQISRDGLPPTRGDALQTVQGYNLGPPPSSSPDKAGQNDGRSLVMCGKGKRLYLGDESGKPGVTNVSKKPKISPSVNVEAEKPKIVPNAHLEAEKPKIVPNAHLEAENLGKKELPLFVDVDSSVPGPRGAEKGPVDVDLSLHL